MTEFGAAECGCLLSCNLHANAEATLQVLEELTPEAESFFIDYAPDVGTDMECGELIRSAKAVMKAARKKEPMLEEAHE